MKRRIRNKFSAYSKQDSAEFRFEQNTMYSPFRKINSNLENLETQKSVLYTDQQQYDSVGLKSKMPYLNLEEDSKAGTTRCKSRPLSLRNNAPPALLHCSSQPLLRQSGPQACKRIWP